MKVSSKGEYALRALLVLGEHHGKVVSIQEISDKTLVTVSYLEQILLKRIYLKTGDKGHKHW
ncbi:Rrf2 family transcriptional regulator [Robertmurraya korlensis]|uniref:Rrf2 family transcriptional regulator n=1 Tax=Robertmurraya korlensis TaxID=519977 RepID=UPI000B2E50B7